MKSDWRQVLSWSQQPKRGNYIDIIKDLGLTILQNTVGKNYRTFYIALETRPRIFGDPTPLKDELSTALNALTPGSTVEAPDEKYGIPSPEERKKLGVGDWGKKKKVLIAKVPVNRDYSQLTRKTLSETFTKEGYESSISSKTGGYLIYLYLGDDDRVWTLEEINKVDEILKNLQVQYKYDNKEWFNLPGEDHILEVYVYNKLSKF
jgi:hypothetical protein